MLTLWYLVLGWKEYNKPFRKPAQPGQQPVDPVKKPDLIPLKKDDKTTDIKKPEPPKSITIDPKPPTVPPRGSDPFFLHNKNQDTPKTSEDLKPTLPSPKIPVSPEVPELPKVTPPKTPETPKMPELPKVSPNVPKTPETPKMPELPKTTPKTPETPKMPELPKVSPNVPKTPETPKMPELPKTTPKTPETPKMPEPPKFTPPKTPESPKVAPGFPKTPESPKMPELPKTPDNLPPTALPSRRPESVLPDFPPSRNVPSEFPMPPYLPGAPNSQKPTSRDDELFAMGNNTGNVNPNRPFANLRDLSYAKGEIPDEAIENGAAFVRKVQENVSRIPKYMEQSIVSDPYSSSEEDEDY